MLLCSSHHKLVHEGGFQIYRDQSGELFFRRPNGKALPRCGYHRDGWVDSGVVFSSSPVVENSREFLEGEQGLGFSDFPDEVNEKVLNYHVH